MVRKTVIGISYAISRLNDVTDRIIEGNVSYVSSIVTCQGQRHKTERDKGCHTIYQMGQSLNDFGNDKKKKPVRVNNQVSHLKIC